ncbi:MAG: segregation/condensation protein A [Candidatus Parvarchaeota archaeon]|jgi:chromatin segregation and condensation protein Rec8/ScpA/Scc1 (kleisin family)|nr:segregation/condensation protein A [Candidatus Parvarchaeota archaeon]MCL5106569.1 segregation/condensation protein A [Candidatus Parvarchaeota archaeon]
MDHEEIYRLILNDELGWEHLITTIIRDEGMDPMDIDLIKIADRFAALISKISQIDFRFGGKFVYTAAILLKMKSDTVVEEMLELNRKKEKESQQRYIKAVPFDIAVTSKLPLFRSRKITLTELINTIRDAMRYSTKQKINFDLKLKEVKIEDRIRLLVEKLAKLFGAKEIVLFSELISKKNDRKEVIYTLLPLLFISNMNKVEISQEEPFKEIYIRSRVKG